MSHFLYQQMILDHSKNPCGKTDNPKGDCCKANNPSCGDKIHMCVTLKDGIIEEMSYDVSGCSISIAAASVLVATMKGQSVETFHEVMGQYLKVLKDGSDVDIPAKLQVFSGVSQYPMRVKCATFVWHAAKEAIQIASYPIQMTQAARDFWHSLVMAQQGQGIHLVFKQVGCMGWQFIPSVVTQAPEGGQIMRFGRLVVFMLPEDIKLVEGTKIDYMQHDDLGQSKVVYQHPNATLHCGCGESFFMGEI